MLVYTAAKAYSAAGKRHKEQRLSLATGLMNVHITKLVIALMLPLLSVTAANMVT
jgi:hypothetical protein